MIDHRQIKTARVLHRPTHHSGSWEPVDRHLKQQRCPAFFISPISAELFAAASLRQCADRKDIRQAGSLLLVQ